MSNLLVKIEEGDEKGVEALLNDGINPNKLQSGKLPLNIAIQKGNKIIIDLLLEHSDDINIVDNSGITPLHEACFIGDLELVDKIINYGANLNPVSSNNFTPLDLAINRKNSNVVEYLRGVGGKVGAELVKSNRIYGLLFIIIAAIAIGGYFLFTKREALGQKNGFIVIIAAIALAIYSAIRIMNSARM